MRYDTFFVLILQLFAFSLLFLKDSPSGSGWRLVFRVSPHLEVGSERWRGNERTIGRVASTTCAMYSHVGCK